MVIPPRAISGLWTWQGVRDLQKPMFRGSDSSDKVFYHLLSLLQCTCLCSYVVSVFLLQELQVNTSITGCIRGDSKALMFVQISPADKDLNETVISLNFACRVRGVDLGPAKRQVDTGEPQKTKMLLDKAKMEAKDKDESIRKLDKNLQNLENKAKGRDHTYKTQQEKIRELEDELGEKSALHSQTDKQISQLQERLKGKEEVCYSLQRKVKELVNNLRESELSDSATIEQVHHLRLLGDYNHCTRIALVEQ